jgi:ATP-dependent Zn protease
MTKNQRSSAYHEAGHVVMFLAVGFKFEYVTINETINTWGHIKVKKRRALKNMSLDIMIKEVMILLAGLEAENNVNYSTKAEKLTGCKDDLKAASEIVFVNMDRDEREAQLFISWVLHRVEKIINKRWVQVEIIAKALLKEKSLTYQEVLKIIKD